MALSVPSGWRARQVNDHTLVFSGPENTPDWLTTLTLTNQQNPDPVSPSAGARAMIADYIGALKNRGGDWEVLTEVPLRVAPGALVDTGAQAVVRFQGASGPVRQWILIFPRTDIAAVHLLIYTAPDDLFERNLDRVRATVESLVPLPSGR
ncbi:hypothetical protein IHV25_01650 [Phaeovibrio sulfidiphilus]|uniref:Uncharacterized protein n=1 Tax=Phaeovibrio sulfidiphilus TaxID=1220600 RepID=A0A8J6YKX2_9PROT|nr:hypothetical protein [Phaeovibrio sulfidiphilus]